MNCVTGEITFWGKYRVSKMCGGNHFLQESCEIEDSLKVIFPKTVPRLKMVWKSLKIFGIAGAFIDPFWVDTDMIFAMIGRY